MSIGTLIPLHSTLIWIVSWRPAYTVYSNIMVIIEFLIAFANENRGLYSSSISDAAIYYRCDFTKDLSMSFNSHFSSSSYEDELIWAAAWLYKATLDPNYLAEAEDLYAQR